MKQWRNDENIGKAEEQRKWHQAHGENKAENGAGDGEIGEENQWRAKKAKSANNGRIMAWRASIANEKRDIS
jgi:hypothetical protein